MAFDWHTLFHNKCAFPKSINFSLWTLAASAVDRCFAILRPFKYNRLMNKKIARSMLGAVWLLSLGLALCPVIG